MEGTYMNRSTATAPSTTCLICGRSVAGQSSGSVVMGELEGQSFTIHARCFLFDTAALGSRLSVLIGWRNEDSEDVTDAGLSAAGLRRSGPAR